MKSFLLDDKIERAIMVLKEFELPAITRDEAGYFVCISGGKDSSVIQQLVIMAEVKAEFHHNHTSVDAPETVYFIRQEKQRLEQLGYKFFIDIPRERDGKQKTMWSEIRKYGLPTRLQRHCCRSLKEWGGVGKLCVTGVRWEESIKRSKRKEMETHGKTKKDSIEIIIGNDNHENRKMLDNCYLKNKISLNVIINWTTKEVWEFIRQYKLPYNPLYDIGQRRIGCVGCPQANWKQHQWEFARHPKIKAAYMKAAEEHFQYRIEQKLPPLTWLTPEQYFEDWENIIRYNKYLLNKFYNME